MTDRDLWLEVCKEVGKMEMEPDKLLGRQMEMTRVTCPACRIPLYEMGYGCHACDHHVRDWEILREERLSTDTQGKRE